ncbi:MAG: hypothetical protein JOZ29_19505 [Deltaproteobacteria bacterium]|nr:hypothetical protein [Deltaproteobacteria bacterium]
MAENAECTGQPVRSSSLIINAESQAALAKQSYAAKQGFLEEREALRRASRDSAGASTLVDGIYDAND